MRTFQRSRTQRINPQFQFQLGHMIPSHAFIVAACIFMLPMFVVVAEHVQLTAAEPVFLFGRWCIHPCHMTIKHTPLMLPSLNNVLPAMVLQNGLVRSSIWCLSWLSSHSSVCHVFTCPSFSIPSGRMVIGVVVVLLLLMSGDIEMNPGPHGEY